ncbi:hypothetical protein G9P44_004671 [Scheffersomyces stipitis]|nr:hypothetical protein G9P44_004671 [Scheffersomyces stipitis]
MFYQTHTPITIKQYDIFQCIGKGNFGDVYKAKCLTNAQDVAIKVVNLDESNEDVKAFTQEIQFLSRLRNPYITSYIETFVKDFNMFIVMEYCGGGSCSDLLRYAKKLPEDIVALIIRDVLKGLVYLHNEKKVHRDIKSANILLTEYGEVKLADFGVSGEITLTMKKRNTFVGTPFWMAPEVITRGKSSDEGGYNEKADIWSTGITTIELVTGSPPLAQYDPMKILFDIPKKRPPVLVGINFSDNIKDFVKYCLIKDPKARPRAKDLLHHQFVSRLTGRNSSVKAMLVKMIRDKNMQSLATGKVKKPKYPLERFVDSDSEEQSSAKVQWDFETFKSEFLRRRSSTTNKEVYKRYGDNYSSLQVSASSPLSPISPESAVVGKSTETKETSPSPVFPREGVKPGQLLFYCVEQVYHRGRTEATQRTVEQLLVNLLEYEHELPGLCEAIVEELSHVL